MLPILPTAPSRTDPVNFSAEADAWVAALPAWTDAVNAIEGSLQASTLIGTSTTSLSVGTGSKGFTSQAGKAWLVGSYLFIVATSDNTKVMQGKVSSYNSSTGSLVVDINLASGSGTYTSWDIGVANPAIGATSGISVAGGTTANWFGMNSTGTPTGLSTGIAAPASDTLGLYTNTVARVRIDASGNVGVGISPSYKLGVGGVLQLQNAPGQGLVHNFADPLIYSTEATGSFAFNGHLVLQPRGSVAGAVIIATGNGAGNMAERMRVDSAGNVGVGVTPSAWTTGNKSVDIGLGCSLSYSSGGVSLFASNTYVDVSSNYTRKLTGYGVMYQQTISDGSHVFYTATTGSAGSIISSWLPVLKLDASGNVLSVGNGGIGYGAGSGGLVTQDTGKSTLVTLNKISGQITTHNASLDANTYTTFTLNNSTIIAGDILLVQRVSGGASGCYRVWCDSTSNGSATIAIQNITGGSLSDAVVLSFAIIRGSTT